MIEFEFTLLDGSTHRETITDPATIFDRIKQLGAVTARAVYIETPKQKPNRKV